MKAPKLYDKTGTTVDSIFDNFFKSFQSGIWDSRKPATDIKEKEDAYMLETDIPGASRDDITVELDEDILTIDVEYGHETEKEEEWDYIKNERTRGHYQYSYRLKNIDEDGIEANYENGVLTVYMPKQEVDNSKRIIDIQ